MRHSCATHMLHNGAEIRYIQSFLGHESIETTKIYLKTDLKRISSSYVQSQNQLQKNTTRSEIENYISDQNGSKK